MIKIKVYKMYKDVLLPEYKSKGAAGMDVHAYTGGTTVRINAGETYLIKTGLKFQIPKGWEVQVRARSGMALKGIQVANSPGTLDYDYRGEIGIILYNSNDYPIFIEHQDRVAQLVPKEVHKVWLEEAHEIEQTERGSKGFGSSGV